MKAVEKQKGRYIKDGKSYTLRPEQGDTLTRDEYAAQNGYTRLTDEVWSLKVAKMHKQQEIAAARYDAEFGGFTDPVSGLFIRTDERTRSLLTAAKLRAQSNAAYLVQNWKTADGSFITLDAPTIIALESAVHDFIEAQFAKEAALHAQIDAAATPEEIKAIHW